MTSLIFIAFFSVFIFSIIVALLTHFYHYAKISLFSIKDPRYATAQALTPNTQKEHDDEFEIIWHKSIKDHITDGELRNLQTKTIISNVILIFSLNLFYIGAGIVELMYHNIISEIILAFGWLPIIAIGLFYVLRHNRFMREYQKKYQELIVNPMISTLWKEWQPLDSTNQDMGTTNHHSFIEEFLKLTRHTQKQSNTLLRTTLNDNEKLYPYTYSTKLSYVSPLDQAQVTYLSVCTDTSPQTSTAITNTSYGFSYIQDKTMCGTIYPAFFSGFYFIKELKKSYPETYIYLRGKSIIPDFLLKPINPNLRPITLEWNAFEKNIVVRSEDQSTAREILTPDFMALLFDWHQHYQKRVHIVIKGNLFHMLIEQERVPFQITPTIFNPAPKKQIKEDYFTVKLIDSLTHLVEKDEEEALL